MKRSLAVLALVAVAACGGESGDDAKSGPVNPVTDWPDCADVWVDGKTLPADYEGCDRGDGDLFTSGAISCDDGSRIVSFEKGDKGWYTDADDVVVEVDGELSRSDSYGDRFASC